MMVTGRMLGRQLRRILDQPLRLRLYSRSDPGLLEGDWTFVELVGGGYQDHLLQLSDWQITDIVTPAVAEAGVQEFRFDGTVPHEVRGAFLTQSDGSAIWAHGFDMGPFEVRRTGDIIPVQPSMRLGGLW